MGPRLFRREGIFYCWVRKRHGGTRKLSTGIAVPSRGASSDDQAKARRSAESVAVGLQERELDPDRAAQEKATLQDALGILMREITAAVKAGELAKDTLEYYREKSGSLLAGITEVLQRSPKAVVFIRDVKASVVDDFITLRREYGAEDSTIGKELNVWKRAMKTAKRRGWWAKDVDDVFPKFSAASNTVERWCSPDDLQKLYAAIVRAPDVRQSEVDIETRRRLFERNAAGESLQALAKEFGFSYASAKRYVQPFRDGPKLAVERELRGKDFFAIICFSIATTAEWSAIWRARDTDIADDLRLVKVRGSKNENRVDRMVPIEFFPFALLLGFARAHGDGTARDGEGRYLFDRRHASAFRRRLKEACERAGIPQLTPNDLRRSHAKWLRLAGVSPAVIAPSMGHVDSRMVELRYGKASGAELAAVQRAELSNPTWVSDAIRNIAGSLMGGTSDRTGHPGHGMSARDPINPVEMWQGLGGSNPRPADLESQEPPTEPSNEPSENSGPAISVSGERRQKPTRWAANGQSSDRDRTPFDNPEPHGELARDPVRDLEVAPHEGQADECAPAPDQSGEFAAASRSIRSSDDGFAILHRTPDDGLKTSGQTEKRGSSSEVGVGVAGLEPTSSAIPAHGPHGSVTTARGASAGQAERTDPVAKGEAIDDADGTHTRPGVARAALSPTSPQRLTADAAVPLAGGLAIGGRK